MQTKYELTVEKKRREKAELENLLRNEMLAEEVFKRTELEREDVLRQKRWAQLPIHNGIYQHLFSFVPSSSSSLTLLLTFP